MKKTGGHAHFLFDWKLERIYCDGAKLYFINHAPLHICSYFENIYIDFMVDLSFDRIWIM